MTYDVWNRAQALHALLEVKGTVHDCPPELANFRFFHARCAAAGVTEDAMTAAEECLRLRSKIEAGDGGAVLDAVAWCAAHELVMPDWLANEYLRRHGAVGRGWAKDWNDHRAFGLAYAKGTNIAGIRAVVNDAGPAYRFAAGLLAANPEQAVDASLYEAVGKHIGVGKTRAAELIKAFLADCDPPPLRELRDRLAGGRSLDQIFRAWSNERTSARLEKAFGPAAPESITPGSNIGK